MIDPQIQAMLDKAMMPQGAGPLFAQQQPWTMMNPSGSGMPMAGGAPGGMNPMMQQMMMGKMMGAMGGGQGQDIRKQKMQQQHQQAMQTAMMQAMRGR